MKGSCLCGKIVYEVDKIGDIANCHCEKCRKSHAAAYAPTARVNQSDFRWVSGEEMLAAFESSIGKIRYFCSACGSHLLASRSGQPHLILRVATLDDDPMVRPKYHIWTCEGVPWLQDDEFTTSHSRLT